MSTTVASEIASYLKHGDHAVAVRRTLDYCLDTGNESLIQNAISWSRTYHIYENAKDTTELPADFTSIAETILAED